ncbi:MAG: TatD family deoxyribonuclease [Myxococcales bacterium]|nr:TatD family deoxyribonuclease [Myxococcales bacterium]
MRVIDSHCHLEEKDFGADRDEVIARARSAGVAHFVVVGSGDSLANVENAVALADANPDMSAAIAIHPHDVARMSDATFARIAELAATNPKVVAVGETGLDYYYDHSPRDAQRAAFRRFIALARTVKKPLTLHIRDAHEDARAIFAEERASDVGAVVHCFTGTTSDARAWLDLGCFLSFSGILTFKTAEEIRRAAALAPEDRILVETDCPYLAPVPYRGRRNEPAHVVETLKVLAQVRGLPLEEMARATVANTQAAFRIPTS